MHEDERGNEEQEAQAGTPVEENTPEVASGGEGTTEVNEEALVEGGEETGEEA